MHQITVVSLGAGPREQLTLGALETLRVLLQSCAADTRVVVLSAPPLHRDALLADSAAFDNIIVTE